MNGMVSCHSVSIHSKSRDISRAQKRIFFLTHLDVRTRSYHCNRFFNVGEFYGRQLACSMKCVAMMMMISTSHMNWGLHSRRESMLIHLADKLPWKCGHHIPPMPSTETPNTHLVGNPHPGYLCSRLKKF